MERSTRVASYQVNMQNLNSMRPPDTLKIKVDFGHFSEQLSRSSTRQEFFFFFKPLSEDIAQKNVKHCYIVFFF